MAKCKALTGSAVKGGERLKVKHMYVLHTVGRYKQLPQQLASGCDFLVSNPPYITSEEMQCLEPEISR